MELSEMAARAAELEQLIADLPAGSITKKTVNGKEYFYHAGQRTRSGGRSIFRRMNWRISRSNRAKKSSGTGAESD